MIEIYKLFIIYFLILITVIFISRKYSFFDTPNERKIYKKKILNTSGVALYIYLLILIYIYELSPEIEEILVAGFFIIICGFIDDRKTISPINKIILMLFPILYLILNNFILDNLGEYEYINKINLGKFGLIFTILSCYL